MGPSAAAIAAKERANKRMAVKEATAAAMGLKVSEPPARTSMPLQRLATKTAEEQADEDERAAEAAANAAATAAKSKIATEEAAAKATLVQETLKQAFKESSPNAKAKQATISDVNLFFTDAKLGAGVSVSGDGSVASSGRLGSQLCNHWMQASSRSPLIYSVALLLEDIQPDTTVGIVGRNFFPSEWDGDLAMSPHSVMMRCGDGSIRQKGRGTSYRLRALQNGAKLNVIVDMQLRELTIELLGPTPGSILSSVQVEGIPAEVTIAVGFTNGPPQRVQVVGCTAEVPGMKLEGKLTKDLWDDDNVIKPLPLNVKKEGSDQAQAQAEIAKVSSSLDQ